MVKLKSSLRKFQTPSRVGWPLRNIRLTDDIGYVPYVVSAIPFPFHECDLPNKTIYRLWNNMSKRQVPHVKQDLLTLPEHLISTPFLVGFVLLLYLYLWHFNLFCLFCSRIVVNIMEFDATVIQVRGLDSFKTRFNPPFST